MQTTARLHLAFSFYQLRFRFVILLVVIVCAIPNATIAQEPPKSPDDVPNASVPEDPNRAPGAFPPNPFGFFRGHGPPQLLQHPRAIGFYFDTVLLAVYFLAFLFWVRVSAWINLDSAAQRLDSGKWNLAMFVCGAVAFALIFVLPRGYGVLFLTAILGLPIYAYVRARNAQVPAFSKVLTRRHIAWLFLRQLSWFGIRVQMAEFGQTHRLRLIGKSDDKTAGVGEAISRQVENSPNYLAAKDLLVKAIRLRASDLHLEPKEGELAVRLRVDGLMRSEDTFDQAMGRNLINIFKILCALDITERRRPQDGSFRAEYDERSIDCRVATQTTQLGEKLSIRLLDPKTAPRDLDQLGLRAATLTELQTIVQKPHGVILVAGPAGAGKSTTLHAALRELDAEQRNVVTIEDPVEYREESLTQIEIRTANGDSFSETLRTVLRQDPDVIMIGEIRDSETAEAVCNAGQTGHLVFSTLHAQDTIAAVLRMQELGTDDHFADTVTSVIAQRLVRKLCPQCKESYKPTPAVLTQAGFSEEDVTELFREGVDSECRSCRGIGYRGQIGIFEWLPLTDALRDQIRCQLPASSLRLAARNEGLITLREEGLRLVAQGVTSLEELNRVLG